MSKPHSARCPNGHNLSKVGTYTIRRKSGTEYQTCAQCAKDRVEAYAATPKGKAIRRKAKRKYDKSPHGRELASAARARYRQTPGGRAALKRASDKLRAKQRAAKP